MNSADLILSPRSSVLCDCVDIVYYVLSPHLAINNISQPLCSQGVPVIGPSLEALSGSDGCHLQVEALMGWGGTLSSP